MKITIKKGIFFLILILSFFQLFNLKERFNPLIEHIWAESEKEVEGIKNEENIEEVVGEVEIKLVPDRIVIENINLDLPVVSVKLENGTWEVLPEVANYAVGTDLISSESGNVGIYGHALWDVFLNIKNLRLGDKILLFSNERKAIYEVTESMTVEPDQVNVFASTNEPRLTLVTCDGIYSEKRYIVTAKLLIKE